MRPFRFLCTVTDILDARQLTSVARQAASTGYSALVMPDHLLQQHAPIPLLAAVAAVTERLRVGTFMLNAGLRYPAVLAQELASLDVLSAGRLEIGIGAGWNQPEHDATGIPFGRLATRVARLQEVLAVLKGCFGDGPFSFAGEHYTFHEYDGQPKPVQRPHPPLCLAGGGRQMLTLAGQQADIVGLAPRLLRVGPPGGPAQPQPDPRSLTVAAADEKIAWVRAAAGDRFGQLELNTYATPTAGPVMVTAHPQAEAGRRVDQLRQRTGVEITAGELLESPHVLIGSVEDLVQKLIGLRERFGISSIMVEPLDEFAPVVERLAGR